MGGSSGFMSISTSLPLRRSRTIRFCQIGGRTPTVTTMANLGPDLADLLLGCCHVSALLSSGAAEKLNGPFDLFALVLLARLLPLTLPLGLLLGVAALEVGLGAALLGKLLAQGTLAARLRRLAVSEQRAIAILGVVLDRVEQGEVYILRRVLHSEPLGVFAGDPANPAVADRQPVASLVLLPAMLETLDDEQGLGDELG